MEDLNEPLLANFFDSLDRLYDGKSSAVDVYFLLTATRAALEGSQFASVAERPLADLAKVVKSGLPESKMSPAALAATESLRQFLSAMQ